MIKFLKYYILFFSTLFSVYSQDERIIKDLLNIKNDKIVEKHYSWEVKSPLYRFDLTGNGLKESFQIEKKDGEDWFKLYNYQKKLVYEIKFARTGLNSHLYKIIKSRLSFSPPITLLIIHHYQGLAAYTNFYANTRLYFLTIEDQLLNQTFLFKGPLIWEEEESFPGRYRQRLYKISIEDLDKDGIKEVIIYHQSIKYIYKYFQEGYWKTY